MKRAWAAAAVLALALLLRLHSLDWGLPLLFNGDEGHFVNTAVSFGSGDLNPHVFKYPTLWMYVLSAAYGLYFVVWSGLGLRAGPEAFAQFFAWQPASFYLIGRVLSLLASLGGLAWLIWAERPKAPKVGPRVGRENIGPVPEISFPGAAAFLAVSPVVVYSAWTAKPDSLMFFFASAAFVLSLRYQEEGGPWTRAALAGLLAGFAFSSQYTALPALLFAPLAVLLGPRPFQPAAFLASGAAAGLGFVLGSPYIALDGRTFLASLADQRALMAFSPAPTGSRLLEIGYWTLNFAGLYSAAGLALVWGVYKTGRAAPKTLLFALGPFVLFALYMSRHWDGAIHRYYLACYPAVAWIAARGFQDLHARLPAAWRKPGAALLVLAALAPGAGALWKEGAERRLPDTRHAATAWAREHLVPGAGVLTDQAFASPDLPMSKEQLEGLRDQAAALGSRRAKYYELLLGAHPGGGWRVWRIKRSAKDLWSPPSMVEKNQKEGAFLDVTEGIKALKSNKIRYVITSSFGVGLERAPELARFFQDLETRTRLLQAFTPEPGRTTGPILRVYELP